MVTEKRPKKEDVCFLRVVILKLQHYLIIFAAVMYPCVVTFCVTKYICVNIYTHIYLN